MTVNLLSRMKGNGHPKSTCEEAIGQVLSSTSLLKKSVAVCSVFPPAASHAGKATQTPSSRSERKIPAERVRATRTQQLRTVRSGPGRRLAQRSFLRRRPRRPNRRRPIRRGPRPTSEFIRHTSARLRNRATRASKRPLARRLHPLGTRGLVLGDEKRCVRSDRSRETP
jgi:hypothetical protein